MRKRERKLGTLEKEILHELSGGDLLYGFLLSARSTGRMYTLARERAQYRYRRKLAIERLKRGRYVSQHGDSLSITERGSNALRDAIYAASDLLKHPPKWDGRWRMVAFDIPEQLHSLRDRVRHTLRRAGFVRLQQSIWVYPYDCKELIHLVQEESDLRQHILLGVLEQVEHEETLLRQFGLSRK